MDLNREFSMEEIKMAKRYLKKGSSSLAIRAMQITALTFQVTPIRITKVAKKSDNQSWTRHGERGALIHC